MKNFLNIYLDEVKFVIENVEKKKIQKIIIEISKIKKNSGRIFFLGVGGSAGNCSHAVNDFRKLCNIECYTPTDNVSELTARVNDDGWSSSFVNWLKVSKLSKKDSIFVFSVGGGNKQKKVSENLVHAIDYAKQMKSKIFSIVGRQDGYAYQKSDVSILIDCKNKSLITPMSESFQAIVWHMIVSHPKLQSNKTKW